MRRSASQPVAAPRVVPRVALATPVIGALLIAVAALGLGGCGQTGPLYLPDSGTVVTRPASGASASTPATPADTTSATPATTTTPTTTAPPTPPSPSPPPPPKP